MLSHIKHSISGSSNSNIKEDNVCLVPRSTYIPPEIDENDESIYNTGINCGIYFEQLNENIKVSGEDKPKKIESFEDYCQAFPLLMENIKKCKFFKPTPIQKYTIPIILTGRDLMASAQTGSGKTVSFILPIILEILSGPHDIIKSSNHSEPYVVIMAPTRELAVQIKTVVLKLTRGTSITSLLCYGGTLVEHQKTQILKGCHILIATPGRLNEFIQHGFVSFCSVKILVLDEADKMLETDLKYDVDKVIDHPSMPSVAKRQTIMVSATLPDIIQQLAASYLKKNYLFLSVGIVSSASSDIKQNIYHVSKFKKRKALIDVLNKDFKGTIIFVKEKWTADFLATYLCEKHFPSISIHGDRLQEQRERALSDFVSGKMYILVATAVASRGLDIKCVNHVINYDMPETIEEYIQRIGRTGRVGNVGKSTSFFDPDYDYPLTQPLIKTLALANQEIPFWLSKLGQEIKDNEITNNDEELEDTDIRQTINSVDEEENW